MKFKVVATTPFEKQLKRLAKKYKSLKDDIAKLIAKLEHNPAIGIHIGKDCYKIRLAIKSKGKGKGGGSRVITCVKRIADIVYLLAIYDKAEKKNISDKELNLLLKIAGLM